MVKRSGTPTYGKQLLPERLRRHEGPSVNYNQDTFAIEATVTQLTYISKWHEHEVSK